LLRFCLQCVIYFMENTFTYSVNQPTRVQTAGHDVVTLHVPVTDVLIFIAININPMIS